MQFIFVLPGKQDKNVRNRGLYNPHCLLRGNKPVCKRSVLFSWHHVIPWALTQHVTEYSGQCGESRRAFVLQLFLISKRGRDTGKEQREVLCFLGFFTWPQCAWQPQPRTRQAPLVVWASHTISSKPTDMPLYPVRNPFPQPWASWSYITRNPHPPDDCRWRWHSWRLAASVSPQWPFSPVCPTLEGKNMKQWSKPRASGLMAYIVVPPPPPRQRDTGQASVFSGENGAIHICRGITWCVCVHLVQISVQQIFMS